MRWVRRARIPDPRDFSDPIHDGDTLWVTVDRGERDHQDLDIRLRFVFAPEIDEPGGIETKIQLLALVGGFKDPWPFSLETFYTKTGNPIRSLDRLIGILWVGDPDDIRSRPTGSVLSDSINVKLMAFLSLHPDWGGGIGS